MWTKRNHRHPSAYRIPTCLRISVLVACPACLYLASCGPTNPTASPQTNQAAVKASSTTAIPSPTNTNSPLTDPPSFATPIQLGGRDILVITGVNLQAAPADALIQCSLEPEQPTSQPSNNPPAAFKLVAQGFDPRLRIECVQTPTRTTLKLVGKTSHLTTVQLIAQTLSPLIPVCLQPREPDRVINAAVGPVAGVGFDGLFDAQHDWAVSLTGRIYYEDTGDRTRLSIITGGEASSDTDVLVLTSEPDFLKRRHNLTGYVPLDPRRIDPMPAAWMPIDPATSSAEIARSTAWMAVNLRPFGAASVFVPDAGLQRPSLIAPPAQPGSTKASALEQMRQSANHIVSRFWGQGFLAQSASSTAIVGDPLQFEQARRYASLLGLSGRSPIAGEQMHKLPDQRVDLLRRIIPAAPIRAVDLFAHHECPPIWNLSVATDAGRWNVLGLFNTSDESRTDSVELEDLHLGTGAEQFAVYDFWEDRLVRIATDRFSLCVPAGGCRVVRVTRIQEHQPTIIGTNRHVTCGGVDLHDIVWNEATLKLTGQSEVAANDPYELWLYLPRAETGLELEDISSTARHTYTRSSEDTRVVTFESDTSGPVTWVATFQRTSSPQTTRLETPRNLQAHQNTRGVLLKWYQLDERAVCYRVYRNQRLLAETEISEYQDSTAFYNTTYEYTVSAVNAHGRESTPSDVVRHQTPFPASANLTQLVPLFVSQEHLTLGQDRSAAGTPLRIADRRIYRGLGTTAPSHIAYFLGGGYQTFSGVVGIDNRGGEKGAACFRIVADGQTLFTSPVLKAGQPALPFSVRVAGKMKLELIVSEADPSDAITFADWGNPYLRATSPDDLSPVSAPPFAQNMPPTQPAH